MEANLTRKGRSWNWEQFHKWEERKQRKYVSTPLIDKKTSIFTMGSCFAENVAHFLQTKKMKASHFPQTTHYNILSILQEVQHLLEEPFYNQEDYWINDAGEYGHPFRKPSYRSKDLAGIERWNQRIDKEARERLLSADIIIITLGGTECWRNPVTKKVYLTIPYPDVFNSQMPAIAEFYNQTFEDTITALREIERILKKHNPQVKLVFSVSPQRMSFTVSSEDIVTANCQSKSTLRTAVGEFVRDRKGEGIYYFPSYELIEYADHVGDLMGHEQRHVNSFAIAYVMSEFLKQFAEVSLFDVKEYERIHQMLFDRTGKDYAPILPAKKKFKNTLIKTLQKMRLYQFLRR